MSQLLDPHQPVRDHHLLNDRAIEWIRTMSRKWVILAVTAIATTAAAVLIFQRPLSVTVVRPESDVPLRIYGLGTVEARVLSRVGFEVGAALLSLSADLGDHVAKDQELAKLHPAEQEARVARAEAAIDANAAALLKAKAGVEKARAVLAEREVANKRLQDLARKDVASVQRAEEAQRDEDVARAEFAVAEADAAVVAAQGADSVAALKFEKTLLEHHRLLSPYDAVVVARHAEPGTVVRAGDPIFTLIDPTSVWIQAYIDEERAGRLALAQPATIRLRSQPQREFVGTVTRIGLESDRTNEERRVWLTCTDCPVPMYLGEQAEVRITTGSRPSALMVPEVAITGFDGHHGKVWLLKDGKLTQATLTFGDRDDRGRVEVSGSLPEGASIVADPLPQGREARAAKAEATP